MNITSNSFKVIDYNKECFIIKSKGDLTSTVSEEIRELIKSCSKKEYPAIYLNAKDVKEMDLPGINEVIHSHYFLQQVSKKLVFVYRKNSKVEKWVEHTGLDKFIETAIVI